MRKIYGEDEFARPKLHQRYPLYSESLADEMSYYPDFEPESLFVAEMDGQVVGALLGAIDTARFNQIYHHGIKSRIIVRMLTGTYGWPGWLPAILRIKWVEREVRAPKVNRSQYPAHLHIGILPNGDVRGWAQR